MKTAELMEPKLNPNGRDESGRFAAGNAGGPGNPFGGKVAKFRKMLMESMTEEDMQDIVKKLLDIAKDGNLQAIKLVLGYTIGKPGALPQPPAEDFSFGEANGGYGGDPLLPGSDHAASVAACLDLPQPPPSTNGDFCTAGEVRIVPENSGGGPRNRPKKLSRRERKQNK